MISFIDFAASLGLIITNIEQGRWVRVPTTDHPHSRNGAYYHGGDHAHCQNWAEMDSTATWFAEQLTDPIQIAEQKKRMELAQVACRIERIKLQHKAAEKAKFILSQCHLDRHPYMDKKGFKDTLVNVYYKDEILTMVIPMFADKMLCGIQTINENGKKFLYGARTSGAYHSIGVGGRIFLVEGYATAMSLHKVLGSLNVPCTVLATFSAGNMAKMAKSIPDCFLCCDNDASGVGQKVGKESGKKWWMPEQENWDINDVLIAKGLFQTSQILRRVL